jgi:hypothetical protein
VSERGAFGIVGVFATPDAIVKAARRLRLLGFRMVEAYTPYPVPGLDEIADGNRQWLLAGAIFIAAAVGVAFGYFLQYWDEALSYPLNVGGRPHNSWPAFMVSTLELALLFAITAGFIGLLGACRLPRLYHPIFAAEEFERASRDRFLLCVEARDPGFEPHLIRRVFERSGAERVAEVAA